MAIETEQLVVSLEARIRDFERNFQKANVVALDNWRSIENRGEVAARRMQQSMAKATDGVANELKRMATVSAGALTAALSIGKLKTMADEWTAFKSRIAAAGVETEHVAGKMQELSDIAIRSHQTIEATGAAYSALKRAQEDLGASEAQIVKATELVGKALTLGGQGADAAKAALLQLSQALSSGTLRGDELNSVLEEAPVLAKIIAKEFGVTVGQLKKLGEEGKITADKVLSAILKGGTEIEGQFAKMTPTISQSVQMMTTALTRWVGEADQATGVSGALGSAIRGIGDNMNVVAPAAAALAAGLSGFYIGGPIVGGIAGAGVALAGFADQLRPVAGDIASLGDYARTAFELIRTGAAEASTWFAAQFARAAAQTTAALSAIDPGEGMAHFLAAVKTVANATIGAFVFAVKSIQTAWDSLGVGIVETIVASMNSVIAAVEGAANKVASAVNSITRRLNAGVGASFPMIQPVDLGRVQSTYRHAGDVAAKGFNEAFAALHHDYVGDIDGALQRLRQRANEIAAKRAAAPIGADDGSLTQALKAPKKDAAGGKSAKAAADKQNDFQREIADLERRARAFDMERDSIGKEAREVEKAKTQFELLEAAKKADMPVTDELKSKIEQLAGAYANSKVTLDEAKTKFEEWRNAIQELGSDIGQAFSSAIIGGEKLSKVLDNLLKKLASRAFDKAFNMLWSSLTDGNGAGMSLLREFIPGFASGGLIQGPGGPRSDSILAAVSAGEFIVNADATRRHGALLAALNSGQIPHFAAGGLVGAPSIPTVNIGAAGHGPVSVAMPITINSNAGTPDQNAELAKRVGATIEQTMRGIIVNELMTQRRPGGLLYSLYGR